MGIREKVKKGKNKTSPFEWGNGGCGESDALEREKSTFRGEPRLFEGQYVVEPYSRQKGG